MASFDEKSLLELGRTPVPGGEPCGSDAADDEQYIFVVGELSKLDRIETDEPDWYRIEEVGENILKSKSKDAEIAAALGLALFKRHSYAGLAASLGMMTALVQNFWDGLFPARPRRRKVRIESLTDRFTEGGWFRDHQPQPDDFDGLDLCVSRIEELEAALTGRMPDDPPDFVKFIRGVREHAGKRPKAAEPAPAPTAAGPATGAAAAAPAPGGATFAAGEVGDSAGALKAVLAAATFMRKADATDPIPYALVRIVKWSKMLLPTTDAAKYQIEPPDASTVDALTHQSANGLWEHLLTGAEAAFRSSDPLWLDLQRYVCTAMAGLGSAYDHARQAVIGLTTNLVGRLGTGVYDLRFRNDMPLCSGETRMWVESEVVTAQGGGGGASADDGRLAEASEKARKLAGSGKLKEALKELQEGLAASSQRRDRFLWRLGIAKLCFQAQRLQLASPLLEECYGEVQRFHIDEWERTLAVEVAQTLYQCRKALLAADKQATQEMSQRVRDSFAWLCQLDPLAALAAEPTDK
ncbi:MAG: type VI secretion system protein TssA [Phycisphaerae bacterium]|nr:type VI secretion system protein TssA [Phycisphaerae bacterium]